jgi:hypothetical protein
VYLVARAGRLRSRGNLKPDVDEILNVVGIEVTLEDFSLRHVEPGWLAVVQFSQR